MKYYITKTSDAVNELARRFRISGAETADDPDAADVILLAADTVAEIITELTSNARKTIIVGSLRRPLFAGDRSPGSLEDTLDSLRPLGMFNTALDRFVGPKDDKNYHLAFSTDHYGLWIEPATPADIMRLVAHKVRTKTTL